MRCWRDGDRWRYGTNQEEYSLSVGATKRTQRCFCSSLFYLFIMCSSLCLVVICMFVVLKSQAMCAFTVLMVFLTARHKETPTPSEQKREATIEFGYYPQVVVLEVGIVELGQNQYKRKPTSVNTINSKKHLACNDHLCVAMSVPHTKNPQTEKL